MKGGPHGSGNLDGWFGQAVTSGGSVGLRFASCLARLNDISRAALIAFEDLRGRRMF